MSRYLYREKEWNYQLITIPIVLFLIFFFTWATVSEIDEVVRGDGNVVPSGQTKIIQHLEGGIISKIVVKEGEKVKRGEPLYMITNSKFKSDFNQVELEFLNNRVKKIRLESSAEFKKRVEFEENLRKKIPDIVENEIKQFNADKRKLAGEIEILAKKMSQKEGKLNELKNRFKNLSIELKLARESLKILEELYKKGAASKREYLSELAKKQELVTDITAVKDSLPTLREEIKEIKEKIALVKNEHKSKALTELGKVEVEINTLLEKRKAGEDRSIREEIVSPVNGVVKKLYFYTKGGIIKAGDKVAEVTPLEDSLTIEAKVKTSDRAHIWMGQKVNIEITAYDFSKYGLLEGELVHISPDSFYDRKGNSYYIVKVKAKDFSFAPNLPILPGMVANISILTGSKTVLEYLLKPLKDLSKDSLSEK